MSLQEGQGISCTVTDYPGMMRDFTARRWYAVFTVPQNEKAVLKHLGIRDIESFLPTYETVRFWKNRQRMKIIVPLFPTYLFVHINRSDRTKVLQAPGVLQIVGKGRESVPLPDSEIEFLRISSHCHQIEPYSDLVIGEKVRIKNGTMRGVEGTLVRKNGGTRFVLTLELINQHAAIQVNADDLEPVAAQA
jgi:transcription antitermination factor NusG